MTFSDLTKKTQSLFHIPIFLIGIGILILFIIFRSNCSPTPAPNNIIKNSTDTNKTIISTSNDTLNNHFDSITTTIKEHNISDNITIPSGHIGQFESNKINSADTCSPVKIYQTIARSDGGFYLVTATVDCRRGTVDSMSVYATPVNFDSSFVDTLISRLIHDSLVITHLKDTNTFNNISLTTNYSYIPITYFSVAGFSTYDPFWSNAFSLGLTGTLRLNQLFDVIATPEINVGPNTPLSFKNIFEANIGLQYHIRMFDVTK